VFADPPRAWGARHWAFVPSLILPPPAVIAGLTPRVPAPFGAAPLVAARSRGRLAGGPLCDILGIGLGDCTSGLRRHVESTALILRLFAVMARCRDVDARNNDVDDGRAGDRNALPGTHCRTANGRTGRCCLHREVAMKADRHGPWRVAMMRRSAAAGPEPFM
jgi:hypothetical protein